MAEIKNSPEWKLLNCTPVEKLRELLEYAERHPEDVTKLLVVWYSEDGRINWQTDKDIKAHEAVYALEFTKHDLITKMRGEE